MTTLASLKQSIFDYAAFRLGSGMVGVELDPAHYETAYEQALGVYRQRSQNATEESYVFVTLEDSVNEYTLPNEVTHVRQVFRRTLGGMGGQGGATGFDPFGSAALNVYLLNFAYSGGLATYELYTGFLELAQRMFGGHMNYTFNSVTKKLRIVRNPKASGSTSFAGLGSPTFTIGDQFAISASIKTVIHAGNSVDFSNLKGTITGATRTSPVSITSPAHGLVTGDQILISCVNGMSELNNDTTLNTLITVTVTGANTLTLDGIDGTGFTAYTSGGEWISYLRTVTIGGTGTAADFVTAVTSAGIPGISATVTGGSVRLTHTDSGVIRLKNVTGTPIDDAGFTAGTQGIRIGVDNDIFLSNNQEDIMLWTYNMKPEVILLQDSQIGQWIKEYTYAVAKQMVGEAREKFATIAGPQGGSSLNGAQIKAEAQAEMDRLHEDLRNYIDGSQPLYWIIG